MLLPVHSVLFVSLLFERLVYDCVFFILGRNVAAFLLIIVQSFIWVS